MVGMLTTLGVANLLGLREWQVRRLFTDGTLPEPQKFGGKRAISVSQLESIRLAAVARGWLPTTEEAPVS